MKVSKSWLKDLVELDGFENVERLLPMRTIGTKEVTSDFIELDMKGYNRADLLSLRGVAYEVAAITDSKVKFGEPKESEYIWVEKSLDGVKAQVQDEDLVPLYCVAKIEGLKVQASSQDWVKKLEGSGVRSVNNIADVTNLVMLEYGQPLHAFDAGKVQDESIIVRRAKKGEKITTLDGKERELLEDDILITDPKKAIGIAGVMGGKDSEVVEDTQTILLEAAIFDPKSLRKTSQRLGLTSEASKRFYHGLTKKRLLQALDAATKMYEQLGGRLTALTIKGDTEDSIRKIPLTLNKTNSLMGVSLAHNQVEGYLRKLNFSLDALDPDTTASGDSWIISPPYWRLDVEIEEDLIEEAARMYGYENIPSKELPGSPPEKIGQTLFEMIYNLKSSLVDNGFTEVQTYSFFSTKILNNMDYKKDELIKVSNPISSETEYLRNHLWPNLLEVIDKNARQGMEDIAIFEVGKVFKPKENDKSLEKYKLAAALYDNSPNPLPTFYQLLKNFLETLNITLDDNTEHQKTHFHPKRFRRLLLSGTKIGKIGEVHKRATDKFGIAKRVAILEISLEKLNL
jgi:phenylalanyl-tRNA synthetase beta chain